MGVDYLAMTIWVRNDGPLDQIIHEQDAPDLTTVADLLKGVRLADHQFEVESLEIPYGTDLRINDNTEWAEAIVRLLNDTIGLGCRRDLTCDPVGAWTSYESGGVSWGDSPTDSFDALCHLAYLPSNVREHLAVCLTPPSHRAAALLDRIDYDSLATQKLTLVELADHAALNATTRTQLDGVVHLLDAITDYGIKEPGRGRGEQIQWSKANTGSPGGQ